ncbi:glutamine--fructose-6-phosphate transaminase (isomerizing) [Dethiothermospora halolimnae]|uniref:glutamine--fructose-6-phosphate transaminase (isomerizing) n=1 Tax=Dethiothermospora halolimnae TaxID=3114390 RepID=UPI003CCBC2EF
MCGIVGYIGDNKAENILIDGLAKLEYRGYDSAGIAVLRDSKLVIRKYKGRLSVLEEKLNKENLSSNVGIGHTRWATHGEPSDANSHPHANGNDTIAVVHNGIIENFMELREQLEEEGYKFKSETDTEVISHLIDYYYKGDILEAVRRAIKRLEGAYAIAVTSKDEPDKLIAVRKDSPLIIGIGNNENFIASDIPAILKYTRNVYILDDGEMAVIKKNEIELMNIEGDKIDKEVFNVTWDVESAEKGGYDHFMIKEIYEQPKALKETLSPRINDKKEINLDGINLTKEEIEKFSRVYIIACGTAYHAGLLGKSLIQKYVKIPVITDVASEFRYSDPFIDENTLMIVVSQSGETADTLAALRLAKENKARVMAVTNVVGSTISREADDVIYTWAGPEIAVASTKAYTTQMLSFGLIALDMAIKKGTLSKAEADKVIDELISASDKVKSILEDVKLTEEAAEEIYNKENVFFIGRGIDYDVAREGSLKLKEISYIHSEAIQAGELKHGTLALIEKGTPVIALATQDKLYDKMLSNMKEVKARGAHVIAVAKKGNKEVEKSADKVIYIPDVLDELASILSVIPLQLLSYYVAVKRGCDVDKPRNLAKSVTVE